MCSIMLSVYVIDVLFADIIIGYTVKVIVSEMRKWIIIVCLNLVGG